MYTYAQMCCVHSNFTITIACSIPSIVVRKTHLVQKRQPTADCRQGRLSIVCENKVPLPGDGALCRYWAGKSSSRHQADQHELILRVVRGAVHRRRAFAAQTEQHGVTNQNEVQSSPWSLRSQGILMDSVEICERCECVCKPSQTACKPC